MAPPSKRASVIVVAWGKRPVTERCLAILDEVLGDEIGGRFELVLVDNGSPDDTAELFAAWRDRATVVALPENRQFAGGCNAGASAATGDVLIFLNNDVDVVPGALEALADQVCEPGVAAAGVRLLYPDGSLQHAGVGMIQAGGPLVVPHHLFHHQAGDLPVARATYDLDVVTGACLAVRREAFESVGRFDEAYANGWEDVDLCLRLRMTGEAIVYRGDLAMVHDEGQTRGKTAGADANAAHFYSRWRALLDPDDDLAERLLDGRLMTPRPRPEAPSGPVVLSGHLAGTGPGADEARAMLAALELCGAAPAVHEPIPVTLEPQLEESEWRRLQAARGRRPPAALVELSVPEGGWSAPSPASIARLAHVPRDGLGPVRAVWAASPALAAALVAEGIAADRISIVPPPIEATATGPGGDGILAVLPTHDPTVAGAVLEALAQLGDVPIRVVPTVGTRGLDELVAERVPGAVLLPPCASERRLATLAGTADVALCIDPDDRYNRRALIASAAGAASVTVADGPAAAVLGTDLDVADPRDPGTIRDALVRALERAPSRGARAAKVDAACGPAAMVALLPTLLPLPVPLSA